MSAKQGVMWHKRRDNTLTNGDAHMATRILWGLIVAALAVLALGSALLFAGDLAGARCEAALDHGAAAYAAMKDIPSAQAFEESARAINAACPSERAQAFYAALAGQR